MRALSVLRPVRTTLGSAMTINGVGRGLGKLRLELGSRLGLIDRTVLAHCWVHRFPMYQWDADNSRWDATHNPFSGVVPEGWLQC